MLSYETLSLTLKRLRFQRLGMSIQFSPQNSILRGVLPLWSRDGGKEITAIIEVLGNYSVYNWVIKKTNHATCRESVQYRNK